MMSAWGAVGCGDSLIELVDDLLVRELGAVRALDAEVEETRLQEGHVRHELLGELGRVEDDADVYKVGPDVREVGLVRQRSAVGVKMGLNGAIVTLDVTVLGVVDGRLDGDPLELGGLVSAAALRRGAHLDGGENGQHLGRDRLVALLLCPVELLLELLEAVLAERLLLFGNALLVRFLNLARELGRWLADHGNGSGRRVPLVEKLSPLRGCPLLKDVEVLELIEGLGEVLAILLTVQEV